MAARMLTPLAALVGVGVVLTVLGGLVSAVTGPLDLAHGSWLAAYLVLVCGVSQCAIGLAQEYLGGRRLSRPAAWTQVACWNVGNAAVVVGTLTATPVIVDLGGLVLLAALCIAWPTTRAASRRVLAWAYRAVIAVLVISIPVGLVLAAVRNGG